MLRYSQREPSFGSRGKKIVAASTRKKREKTENLIKRGGGPLDIMKKGKST